MSVTITSLPVGSYPLLVCGQGQAATNLLVSAGGTIYYRGDRNVSSSDTAVTNGSNVTVTGPTWIISASSSAVTVTDYPSAGDMEAEFATWQPLNAQQQVPLAGSTSAGQLLATGTLNTFVAVAGTATGQGMFYLDPALFPGGLQGRTPKIRIRGNVTTNAVAPACTNLVYGLVPVATVGGASAAVPTVATVSAATVAATIVTPLATTQTVGTSASAPFPAAGWYAFSLTVGTGGTAANANTIHGFELQVQRTAP